MVNKLPQKMKESAEQAMVFRSADTLVNDSNAIKLPDNERIKQLYNGDIGDYPSRSEAELALVSMLVKEGYSDSEVDKLMMDSKTERWKERQQDYRDRTLRKAKQELKKKEKPKIVYTSFIDLGETLVEQVYDPKKNITSYLVYKNGSFDNVKYLDILGQKYSPINDGSLIEGVVLLPSTAIDFGSTEGLIDQIKDFIHKYVDVSLQFEQICAWYVLLTWVSDKVSTISYLRALGDTSTGKSRWQNVVGGLCYKFCKVSGAITPAPIYRMIEKWRGTLGIEEADFRDSSEKNEVITILNCGFERGNPVIRADKNVAGKVHFSSTFGPKLITSRRTFNDVALESRCLTEKMAETSRKDIQDILPQKFYEEQLALRNKLLAFRLKNLGTIKIDAGIDIDLGDVEPRLRQATRSFASLFANLPDTLKSFKEFLQVYQRELIDERADSTDGLIVNALANLLVEHAAEKKEAFSIKDVIITTKDITEWLAANTSYKDATVRSIRSRLKSLNIDVKLQRKGKEVAKRLIVEDTKLSNIFKRYISDAELLKSVTDVTIVTHVTVGRTFNNIYNNVDLDNNNGPSVTKVTTVTSVTADYDGNVIFNGKFRGRIVDDKYISSRDSSHYMKKYQGFGVSRSILDFLHSRGVNLVEIQYQGAKGHKRMQTPLQNFLDSKLSHVDDSASFEDEQLFLPEKEMVQL